MTFQLDSRLDADTIPVGDLALSSVLLLNDARFPWFVLVPRVEGVSEITDLIAAQRAYEMNSKVITAADQMLQTTSNLMR